MATKLSASGLVFDDSALRETPLTILDSVLRGVGQVMLQNNSFAGLFFWAGIFYSSRLCGFAVILGAAVSTLFALLLGIDRRTVRAGLFGFNGALIAVALATFLHSSVIMWVSMIFAAAITTVLMAAMLRWLEQRKISPLTAPFVLTALCFLPAYTLFGRLHPTSNLPIAGLPKTTIVMGAVGASTLAGGLFNGVAQVFFQANVITGVLFAIGLLISSRRAFGAALLGSFVGFWVAWAMGAAEPTIHSGLFGFNCVLTAIAMGSAGFVLDRAYAFYSLVAIVATTIVFAALSGLFAPAGMPALTLPFVLVVWVFVSAGHYFPGFRPDMPHAITCATQPSN
ncbi:MAG: urea transporter [Acidobacteria bacterium]|nr:MAG: urea transporter [Acidobacteriota bacterium]